MKKVISISFLLLAANTQAALMQPETSMDDPAIRISTSEQRNGTVAFDLVISRQPESTAPRYEGEGPSFSSQGMQPMNSFSSASVGANTQHNPSTVSVDIGTAHVPSMQMVHRLNRIDPNPVSPVPEPGPLLLLAVGLFLTGLKLHKQGDHDASV